MRKSKLLARLRSNRPARICALGHFIPAYITHAAHFGYDAIWLDLEHRAFTDREVQTLLAYAHLADIDCLLRPATIEKTRLYRYLEDGAAGLMIPHVSTREQAEMLVDAVKFPPIGSRGLDAAGLDSNFLLADRHDYVKNSNNETYLVIQIETIEAVEHVEDIAAVAGLDGLFVGPADLNLRIENSDTTLTVDVAIQRVADAAERYGIAWGCPAPDASQVANLYERGARLIAFGGDFGCLMEMLREKSSLLREVYGD